TYNKTLEQEAEAAYNRTLQGGEASRVPYDSALKRFNVTTDMDKRTFKADRVRAFMDALHAIRETVVSMFYLTLNYQIGCFTNLNNAVCELSLYCQFD
ncbi:hypothetical protein GCK32_010658, partial [Trichostrongylus colubriformis]